MTRRLAAPLRIALALILLLQAAWAVPTAAIAGLHAARCCATHCAKAPSGEAAKRCCRVLAGTDVQAAAPGAVSSIDPAALAASFHAAFDPPREGAALAPVSVGRRAGPVFQLTQPLRL